MEISMTFSMGRPHGASRGSIELHGSPLASTASPFSSIETHGKSNTAFTKGSRVESAFQCIGCMQPLSQATNQPRESLGIGLANTSKYARQQTMGVVELNFFFTRNPMDVTSILGKKWMASTEVVSCLLQKLFTVQKICCCRKSVHESLR